MQLYVSSQHRNILKTPNIIILFLVMYFFQISLTQWKINSRPVKVDVTSVVVLLHPPYRSPASFKGGLISEGIYNLHKKKCNLCSPISIMQSKSWLTQFLFLFLKIWDEIENTLKYFATFNCAVCLYWKGKWNIYYLRLQHSST